MTWNPHLFLHATCETRLITGRRRPTAEKLDQQGVAYDTLVVARQRDDKDDSSHIRGEAVLQFPRGMLPTNVNEPGAQIERHLVDTLSIRTRLQDARVCRNGRRVEKTAEVRQIVRHRSVTALDMKYRSPYCERGPL
jgi:hypothetical protein